MNLVSSSNYREAIHSTLQSTVSLAPCFSKVLSGRPGSREPFPTVFVWKPLKRLHKYVSTIPATSLKRGANEIRNGSPPLVKSLTRHVDPSFYDCQHLTAVDRGAGFSIQGDHRAGFGRFYFVLHLHGFDYQDTVTGRYFSP